MTAEIIAFHGETTLDLDPDQVIATAKGLYPQGVLILGWNDDGDVVMQSSIGDAKDIVWLIECAKKHIMDEWGGGQ